MQLCHRRPYCFLYKLISSSEHTCHNIIFSQHWSCGNVRRRVSKSSEYLFLCVVISVGNLCSNWHNYFYLKMASMFEILPTKLWLASEQSYNSGTWQAAPALATTTKSKPRPLTHSQSIKIAVVLQWAKCGWIASSCEESSAETHKRPTDTE